MSPEILKYCTACYIIDNDGLDHIIEKDQVLYYMAQAKFTVKLEGLEQYYQQYRPKTVHMYISPKGAKSFPVHTDPYDVELKVIEGIKTIEIQGEEKEVSDYIFIPKDTAHRATNKYSSIILSIGDE